MQPLRYILKYFTDIIQFLFCTVIYLENCTKEELYYVSEIFEDISERLQSKIFIECLRKLDKKFPEMKMTKDIDLAETYI